MPTGHIDLDALVRRLADRDSSRTEANVQSSLHALLLSAPLQLAEHDLKDLDVVLEQQAGARKRIDVEAGLCVFEVKRDLRKGHVRTDAIPQLAGYVASRTEAMNQRYVGVLTDGAEWQLYHLNEGALQPVSPPFFVDASKPDIDGLCVWLEGVLATSEKIRPTPREIERRLGALSPGHQLDYAELHALYARHRNLPTVKLKRQLWARLLTTALGTSFKDTDELFVEHTLLVNTAEVIAHAVMGFEAPNTEASVASIVTGQQFISAQVYGVVDADFFDWPIEVPGGERFVRGLVRRLSRFAWHDVEHDVLKVLYESVISTVQRKQLGEYYTPDWLAECVVSDAITDPLSQRVLDPACGSGTFVFHAVRRYLDAAASAGMTNAEALTQVTQKVLGMDLHPVAVTFARVTYLLAIGTERLRADDRPPISIPIYLGDSIQWGQERTLFSANALVIPTGGSQLELFTSELRFPLRTLADAGRFDQLVSELADMASIRRARGSAVPPLTAIFRRFGVHPEDQPVLTQTFKSLCRLHDQGTNHIWGYYVRNLARPVWLTRPEHHVDVLIGNPPWLSYRFMTDKMQKQFRDLSEERGIWATASVVTQQDLSALFVLRCIERYLSPSGRFGFVMPWSVLRGRQFAAFRTGRYSLRDKQSDLTIMFAEPWDLHAVKPTFFLVPCCVIRGQCAPKAAPLPSTAVLWSGKLPHANLRWERAQTLIRRTAAAVTRASDSTPKAASAYGERFANGATLFPRVLLFVEKRAAGPLGAGAGRVPIRSRRSATEKMPWKKVLPLDGAVEKEFIAAVHLGETVLPYRPLAPLLAVIPWDGSRLLDSSDERLALYPGLEEWWKRVEQEWEHHRSKRESEKGKKVGREKDTSFRAQIDYRRKLTSQLKPAPLRVVYSKSGMYLAAALITDRSIIDHKLYWGVVGSIEEGRFLEAILNSNVLTERVRPLQARGEHNPRDFDKYVWQLPIPLYDPTNKAHVHLANLASEAEQIAAKLSLPAKRFETLRRLVREAIAATDTGRAIEEHVAKLLG